MRWLARYLPRLPRLDRLATSRAERAVGDEAAEVPTHGRVLASVGFAARDSAGLRFFTRDMPRSSPESGEDLGIYSEGKSGGHGQE
jgi:hypothetical protein